MTEIKRACCAVIGVIGAFVAKLFGGWSDDMVTLVIVMTIDFVMGIALASIFKISPKSDSGAVSSKSCFKGLCKKCSILLFVLISYRLDLYLNTDYIKTATIIGFIANELISIVENAGLMGVPLPVKLIKAIEVLKDKGENFEEYKGSSSKTTKTNN